MLTGLNSAWLILTDAVNPFSQHRIEAGADSLYKQEHDGSVAPVKE